MKWASWVTLIAGIWLIIAPFALGYTTSSAKAEDVIFGILIVALSLASAAAFAAWLVVLFGIWVIIAPWVLGYSGLTPAATSNDVITGIIVLVFGLIAAATGARVGRGTAPPTIG